MISSSSRKLFCCPVTCIQNKQTTALPILPLSNSNYQWITTLTRKLCVKSMKHALNPWNRCCIISWIQSKHRIYSSCTTWKYLKVTACSYRYRMMDKIQIVVRMPESQMSNDIFIAKMSNLVDFNKEVLLLDFKLSWFKKQF